VTREGNLTILTRIRASHPGWLVTQSSPRQWTAARQDGSVFTARSLRTLEQRLDESAEESQAVK
jgi:hypothetical protein